MTKKARAWIIDTFKHALQHDMPYNWTTNWIITLHQGGV